MPNAKFIERVGLTFKRADNGFVPPKDDMVSRSILPLFAHYQGGEFQMVGVGWIVATFGQTAVMLTAKHVHDPTRPRLRNFYQPHHHKGITKLQFMHYGRCQTEQLRHWQ